MRISDCSSDVCSSDLFAAQQHLAPKFVARFLEGRIEAVDRDFGVFARLPLDRRGRAEAFAVVTDEAVARDARVKGFGDLDAGVRRIGDESGARKAGDAVDAAERRSEEHTSALQSLMRISYADLCLNKKKTHH